MNGDGTSQRAVAVVVDSTSDIPPTTAEAEGLTIVPLTVTIDGESFRDGELSQAEFFRRMDASKELPSTSTPSPGEYADVYKRVLETASEIVSVHVSTALSASYESARQAAEGFGGRVHVFDSKNLSWGLGFQAIEAAREAARGGSVADVLAAAERTRDSVRMLVSLDKLDNLSRGGRIGAVSAFIGGLLNLKVCFTVDHEGKFEPVGRDRGAHAGMAHTMKWIGEQMGERCRGRFCVMHAMAPDKAEWFTHALEEAFDVVEMHVVETGVVISTHTGTGWGVAVVPLD